MDKTSIIEMLHAQQALLKKLSCTVSISVRFGCPRRSPAIGPQDRGECVH
jgi:hypothetical protein